MLAALCVLLIFAGGIYALSAFHPVAATVTRAPDERQTAAPPDSSIAKTANAQLAARGAPNPISTALGAGAKGGPDPAKAPDNTTQAGSQVAQDNTPSGSTSGTSDAANTGQAANAVAGFLGALSSAVGGTHRHDPVDFHTLEALLPSSLPGLQPATPAGNADETMSIKTTSAQIDFNGPNNARINVSIRDATAISGLAGLADMANSEQSEQGDSYEKTETIDGRSVHEKWDAPARHGTLSLSVGQRFAVDVTGDNVDMGALKNALAHIDLAKLESMKDANPVSK